MRTLTSRAVTALSLVLGLTATATAADLFTPTLFLGGPNSQNICVVTNVGPAPITVTVRMVTLSGTTDQTCTIQPADPGGCQNFANALAYCQVVVQGSTKRVRAIMMNRETVSPFTIFATAEAH